VRVREDVVIRDQSEVDGDSKTALYGAFQMLLNQPDAYLILWAIQLEFCSEDSFK
jgi:hypothetical protein